MVYLIEDQMDKAILAKKALERVLLDQTVFHFMSGKSLFEKLEEGENYPKLILLDLHMLEMNGIEVLKVLKQHPKWKRITVIIWTDWVYEPEISQCYAAGADSYIIKPVQWDLTLDVMRSIKHYWFESIEPST